MKITDEYLRAALPEAMDAYIREVEADEAPKPSPEFNARVDAIVQEQRAQARKGARRSKPVYRVLQAAAVVLLVLAVGGFGLSMTVRANRQGLAGFCRKVYAEFTELFVSSQTPDNTAAFAQAKLTWLPEGFEKTLESIIEAESVQQYMNEHGEYITVKQVFTSAYDGAVPFRQDSENALVQPVKIGRFDGYLCEKDGRCDIFWTTEQYVFRLTTSLSAETALRIAERIEVR